MNDKIPIIKAYKTNSKTIGFLPSLHFIRNKQMMMTTLNTLKHDVFTENSVPVFYEVAFVVLELHVLLVWRVIFLFQ